MALFGDITKSLFGKSGSEDTIKQALAQLQNIQVPTAESMQIQLEKLVQAGVLTPEQAQAALINSNAFDDVTASNAGLSAELDALGQLQNIVNQGGRDAQEQADLARILNEVQTSTRGANEAVLQDQAARGALTSGLTLAAQLGNIGQGAQLANQQALGANAAAEARKMDALRALGSLGGNVQGQQYGAAADRANAANAIAQFNAQQSNAMNQFNTAAKNQAQQYNLTNAQEVANRNVAMENANRERNSNLIQQNFQNQLNKAQAGMGGAQALAGQQQNAFNQNMNLWGGIIGSAANAAGGMGSGGGNTSTPRYGGQYGPPPGVDTNQYSPWGFAHGGRVDMTHGGSVPGTPKVPGDSPANDTVPARLSPGEVVLPRSVVQNPDSVHGFLERVTKDRSKMQHPSIHPKDISAVLSALTELRAEGPNHE